MNPGIHLLDSIAGLPKRRPWNGLEMLAGPCCRFRLEPPCMGLLSPGQKYAVARDSVILLSQ